MKPKLVFFLMVLIIIVLWYAQKFFSQKSKHYNDLERKYFESIKRYIKKEISKDELIKAAEQFFSLTGIDKSQIVEKVEKDIAIHEV